MDERSRIYLPWYNLPMYPAPLPYHPGIRPGAPPARLLRTGRTMNTRPTIRVPIGYRMTVILGKDLWLKPRAG